MSQTDNKTEEQMIKAAKEDLSNFTALYEKYFKAVYRYSYKRVSLNKSLAEDITSETFVKAIENFEKFDYTGKPFVAWLYQIAHNLIVDYFRSKKEQNVSLDSLVIPPEEDKESILSTLSKEELKKKITDNLEKLPDEVRNLFTLKLTEDLTFKQIAKTLDDTEGAVKMRYYRGIELLEEIIKQEERDVTN